MALSGYISLDEAKGQVAIERENTSQDERLERLLGAAEKWAENFLGAPLADFQDSPVEDSGTIPENIKSAILLHMESEFDRDVQLMDKLIERARDLLWPHRVNVGV